MKPRLAMETSTLLAAALLAGCFHETIPEKKIRAPAGPTIAITAPAEFEFKRFSRRLLPVSLRGERLDPASRVPVGVVLQRRGGPRIEAQPAVPVTLGSIATGEGDTYFDLLAAGIPDLLTYGAREVSAFGAATA